MTDKKFLQLRFDEFAKNVQSINKKYKFYFECDNNTLVCYQEFSDQEFAVLTACFKHNPIRTIHAKAREKTVSILKLPLLTDKETIVVCDRNVFQCLKKYGFVPKFEK